MKKSLIIFAFITFTFAAFAQDDERSLINKYCDLLVNDLLEKSDGYLKNDTWDTLKEGGLVKSTLIGLPDSYNFDLARSNVRLVVRKYPEIRAVTRWQPGYDSFYHVVLELPDKLAGIIYYSNKVKTLKVTVGRMEGSN